MGMYYNIMQSMELDKADLQQKQAAYQQIT